MSKSNIMAPFGRARRAAPGAVFLLLQPNRLEPKCSDHESPEIAMRGVVWRRRSQKYWIHSAPPRSHGPTCGCSPFFPRVDWRRQDRRWWCGRTGRTGDGGVARTRDGGAARGGLDGRSLRRDAVGEGARRGAGRRRAEEGASVGEGGAAPVAPGRARSHAQAVAG